MNTKTNIEGTTFDLAHQLFDQNINLFFKLVLFFAPITFIVQLSGILLNTEIENAEAYARIATRGLLLCMGYMWLKALMENKATISPLHEINLSLLGYLSICLIFMFGPLWLIDTFDMGVTKLLAQPPAFFDLLTWCLDFGALFISIRLLFLLPEYIQTGEISLRQSFQMTKPVYIDLLWDYIRYAIRFAILIALYPMLITLISGLFSLHVPNDEQPIVYYILYSPISLFVHPLLLLMGFTVVYVAYRQICSAQADNETASPDSILRSYEK